MRALWFWFWAVLVALTLPGTSALAQFPDRPIRFVIPFPPGGTADLLARLVASLDQVSNGRIGWNMVTGSSDFAAMNYGMPGMPEHDLRYDRADEFLETTLGHWDTWEEESLVVDKESGLFAHPDKVKRLDHKGKFFNSRGPFTVPRSPQGQPV